MKDHRYCHGEGVQAHEFTGKTWRQAFKRLGDWLDENGGNVVSVYRPRDADVEIPYVILYWTE